jgi:poly(A) polymerase
VTETLDKQALGDLLRHPRLRLLLEALNGDGEETRLVGGAVRNALLGRPVTDRDCTTTATPHVTMQRAEAAGFKPVPTGIEHGTVTVVVDGEPFEVTTLREDVTTDGRRAVVRFGRDFAADARRRDFTINALSVSRDGRLHDYTGGVADLAARRVRFIGDARNRIREDFLRILRFFRFHAEYGEGEPDPAGLAAAVRERAGLAGLSHERIRTELLKLLAAPGAVETLQRLASPASPPPRVHWRTRSVALRRSRS